MLEKYQQAFLKNIYQNAQFDEFIANKEQFDNFDIHINNCFLALIENLQSKFRHSFSLLGKEYFELVARKYIRQFPLRSGCNNDFGGQFPNFLSAQLQELGQYEYVATISEIEFLIFQTQLQPNEKSVEIAELSESINCQKGVRLKKSVAIVAADFNALDLFNSLENQQSENFIFDRKPENILIWVDETNFPSLMTIGDFSSNLVNSLLRGDEFIIALESHLGNGNQMDNQMQLLQLCEIGVFTNIGQG